MAGTNLNDCAADLLRVARKLRDEAHGRADSLSLHDMARAIETQAERLYASTGDAKPAGDPTKTGSRRS